MMYQACMSLWQGNRNSGAAKANSIKFQLFKTKFHGCRPISFCVSVYILIHQVTQGIYKRSRFIPRSHPSTATGHRPHHDASFLPPLQRRRRFLRPNPRRTGDATAPAPAPDERSRGSVASASCRGWSGKQQAAQPARVLEANVSLIST